MNKKAIVIPVVGLILAAVGVAGFLFFYQPGQRQSFVEQGEAAYAAGDYSAAVQAYHQAEAIRPEGDETAAQAIFLGRGLAHWQDENFPAAIDDLNQVDGIETMPEALTGRFESKLALGQTDEAVADLTLLVDQADAEEKSDLIARRGMIWLNSGDEKAAQSDFESVMADDPIHQEAGLGLLGLYLKNGADSATVEALTTRLIDRELESHLPALTHGRIRLDQGLRDEANGDFQLALMISPGQVDAERLLNFVENGASIDVVDVAETDLHLAIYQRGQTHLANGRPDGASADAEQIIQLKPELFWGYALRGDARFATGALPQALEDFNRALELSADKTGALLTRRAAVFVAQEAWGSATVDLDQRLAVDPTALDALLLKAQVQTAEGQADQALVTLDTLLAQEPSADGYRMQAEILIGQNELEAAEEPLTWLVEQDGADLAALKSRSTVYLASQNYVGTVEDATSALAIDPTDPELYALRIQGYLGQSDIASAERDAQRALAIDDDMAVALLAQGLAKVEAESYFEAVILLSDAIDEDEELAAAYAGRAEARFWQNEPDRAQADANRAIELDDSLPQAWISLALVEAYERNWGDALEAAATAVDLAPENGSIVGTRGLIYFDGGDYSESLDDFDTAIELEPEEANWHLLRADVLNELQRFEESKLALAKAIELSAGETDSISVIEVSESLIADIERIPEDVEGFRTWRDDYHGFEVTYPAEWQQFVDPGFSSPIFIQGPLDRDFRVNLSVSIIEDINLTTGQLSRAFDPPTSLPDYEQVSSRGFTIGGRSGVRKEFRWTSSDSRLRDVPVAVIQVYALSRGRAFIFTATMQAETFEKYEPVINDMLASFKLD